MPTLLRMSTPNLDNGARTTDQFADGAGISLIMEPIRTEKPTSNSMAFYTTSGDTTHGERSGIANKEFLRMAKFIGPACAWMSLVREACRTEHRAVGRSKILAASTETDPKFGLDCCPSRAGGALGPARSRTGEWLPGPSLHAGAYGVPRANDGGPLRYRHSSLPAYRIARASRVRTSRDYA